MDGEDQGGRVDRLVLVVRLGSYARRRLVLEITLSVVGSIREHRYDHAA